MSPFTPPTAQTFASLYAQGMVRGAVATQGVRLADPHANARAARAMMQQADAAGAGLLVLPELGITGYSIEDLLHQQVVLDAVEDALSTLAKASRDLLPLTLVLGHRCPGRGIC